jgi:hypothetical protein
MSRSISELSTVLAALAACTAAPNTLAVCARGDRDVLATRVATVELSFFDGNGGAVGAPVDLAPHDVHIGAAVPAHAATFRITGLDATGATIAHGQAQLEGDGGCVCFALDAQAAVACQAVTCRVVDGSCVFHDGSGSVLGTQTVGFGEAGDITGVTSDAYLDSGQPTTPHDNSRIQAGPSTLSPFPTRVGLIRFDLSEMPASAVIDNATLVLHVCNTSGCPSTNTLELHPMLEPWTEMDATWNDGSSGTPWSSPWPAPSPNASWATPCQASPCGATTIGTIANAPADTILSIPIAVAQIASWVAAPATNFGLAILRPARSDGTPIGSLIEVDASEAPLSCAPGTQCLPPRLDLSFHLP